jgi:ethanolamine-phosphate phospho-lyase
LTISPYKYEHSKEFDKKLKHPTETTNFVSPGRHIWKVPCPDTYRGLHRDITKAGAQYASFVQDACRFYTSQCGESVSAFIVEGGMSVAGVILPPPDFLRLSVQAVREAGGVYIADEVQTGLGRLGVCAWAFQYGNMRSEGDDAGSLVPDIVTVGKPFGNGMPLGAVVMTRAVAASFDAMGVEYFNTFGGNPVCAAAGLAVLKTLESERLQEHALVVGNHLLARFRDLQQHISLIGDIRGSGLFVGIELVRNRHTLEPATEETSFLCTTLKEKYQVLCSIDGLHDNVLVVKPPLAFSREDADLFVACFEKAVAIDLPLLGEDIRQMPKTPT